MVTEAETLLSIREHLLGALAGLERLRCGPAAAHLGSAIDAIEQVLSGASDGAGARVSTRDFASRMRREFGPRAESVAGRQLEAADRHVHQIWSQILSDLRAIG